MTKKEKYALKQAVAARIPALNDLIQTTEYDRVREAAKEQLDSLISAATGLRL